MKHPTTIGSAVDSLLGAAARRLTGVSWATGADHVFAVLGDSHVTVRVIVDWSWQDHAPIGIRWRVNGRDHGALSGWEPGAAVAGLEQALRDLQEDLAAALASEAHTV